MMALTWYSEIHDFILNSESWVEKGRHERNFNQYHSLLRVNI